VSWSDWLLAFHLLSAFALMSGLVAVAALQVAAGLRKRPSEIALLMRLAVIPGWILNAGAVGALLFGIWLALDLDAYSITDGWILAAIVLWLLGSGIGAQGDKRSKETRLEAERVAAGDDVVTAALGAKLRDPVTLALNWGSVVVFLAILVDMIWKPGH
jgi:uncharacterized membrane protein